MKSLLTLTLFAFCLTNLNSQITISSVDVIKYPTTSCNSLIACDSGEIKINLTNTTPNYLWNVYSLSSVFYNRSGVSSADSIVLNTCYDTLVVHVQDTMGNTFYRDTIIKDSLTCPVDTIGWYHPKIKLDSVILVNSDSLNPSTGRVRVVPVGGVNSNYVYYLDTIIRDSIPNPPLFTGQGLANYRGWQDTGFFELLEWRWYGVSCIDTSILLPITAVKPGYTCATGCPAEDTLTEWVFVPKTFFCTGGRSTDCDPYTGSYASRGIFGGLPPFTVSVVNTSTNTTLLSQKVYNYTGNYSTPSYYMDNCESYLFTITDSLGKVCDLITEDKKETIFTVTDSTQSRVGTCCDGTLTFSMQTQTCGPPTYYTVTGNGFNSSGLISNSQPATVYGLCGNETYTISDGSCSISHYIVMNDRECDSSASVNEINEYLTDVKLFPNPTSNQVNLEINSLNTLNGNINVAIVDAVGKVVFNDILNANNKSTIKHIIDINNLNTGIYNLVLEISGETARKTLIKQ